MKNISKNQLKAKMLAIFREIEKTGEEVIVTDRHRPVLRISPLQSSKRELRELFAPFRGQMKYSGSLTTDTTEEWGDLV